MRLWKPASLAAAALVLSTSAHAAVVSITAGLTGSPSATYVPTTYGGTSGAYVFGIGATLGGNSTSYAYFDPFDTSLGTLVGVTLNYTYSAFGSLFGGGYGSTRQTGVRASTGFGAYAVFGFDFGSGFSYTNALGSKYYSTNVVAFNDVYSDQNYVPWDDQVEAGYYVGDTDYQQFGDGLLHTINFDSGFFTAFINNAPAVATVAAVNSASLDGCNLLSNCAMTASAGSSLSNLSLVYTYDNGLAATPAPAAEWLFASGLLGMIGLGVKLRT